METYQAVELACDPPGWHREIDEWDKAYGSVVLMFETNPEDPVLRLLNALRELVAQAVRGGVERFAGGPPLPPDEWSSKS